MKMRLPSMANNIESSSTRFLLIRHGETEWNRIRKFQGRSDVPLNQKGKDQGHPFGFPMADKQNTCSWRFDGIHHR